MIRLNWTEYTMSTMDFQEPCVVLNFKEMSFSEMLTNKLK